jgi:conjugal transfer pilus assembly protein TraU
MRMSTRNLVRLALLLIAGWCMPAHATCNTDKGFVNVISDIAWDCIFPITIMGVPIDEGDHPPDDTNSEIECQCPGKRFPNDPGLGFMVGFWEPARMVDTTNDPWCFPALGMDMSNSKNKTTSSGWGYSGSGQLRKSGPGQIAFAHFHYYVFPVWAMLNMFTDIPCISEDKEFDLAMVSEVRPDWGDDLTAMQLYPETALMASPITALACIVDAVASTAQRPVDALYWCMGGWGTTYPMTGHINVTDYAEANAGIAGKALYVQARFFQLTDRVVNYCHGVPIPIWIKSHWRMQEIDPVSDSTCHAIGHPGILWTDRKNPVGKQDNFSWMIFRKVECCVVVF